MRLEAAVHEVGADLHAASPRLLVLGRGFDGGAKGASERLGATEANDGEPR